MSADDEVTITVLRADIERVLSDESSIWQNSAIFERLRAAIPEPEWEPSEEQIAGYAGAFGFDLPRQRVVVIGNIRKLREAGFTL